MRGCWARARELGRAACVAGRGAGDACGLARAGGGLAGSRRWSRPGGEERVGRRGEWVGRGEREREAGLGYFGLRVGFGLSFGLGSLLILSPFYFYF